MAKPNYQFEKRQRELEKKKKKAEKAQKKAVGGSDGGSDNGPADAEGNEPQPLAPATPAT
jgi:hypothetical protein